VLLLLHMLGSSRYLPLVFARDNKKPQSLYDWGSGP
jgi:hypothetical protein